MGKSGAASPSLFFYRFFKQKEGEKKKYILLARLSLCYLSESASVASSCSFKTKICSGGVASGEEALAAAAAAAAAGLDEASMVGVAASETRRREAEEEDRSTSRVGGGGFGDGGRATTRTRGSGESGRDIRTGMEGEEEEEDADEAMTGLMVKTLAVEGCCDCTGGCC